MLLEFVYRYFNEFQLMFHAPEGSKYADIREKMVHMEMESAKAHEDSAREIGLYPTNISEKTMHIFFTMSLTPLFEIIEHKVPYEEAVGIIDLIAEAQNYAWTRLVELNPTERPERKD